MEHKLKFFFMLGPHYIALTIVKWLKNRSSCDLNFQKSKK